MDNSRARKQALTRYLLLMQQGEIRLIGIKHSHRSNDLDRETVESALRVTARKITNAQEELRILQGLRKSNSM
jgi:hypothetical protein